MLCVTRSSGYLSKSCSTIKEPQNMHSISCSVMSQPKATIAWLKRPPGCSEQETKHCSLDLDGPEKCVYQLSNVCAGEYLCQATFNDGAIEKTITGDSVLVLYCKCAFSVLLLLDRCVSIRIIYNIVCFMED
jgi:hypothetical protein